jgi:hypothetical protein
VGAHGEGEDAVKSPPPNKALAVSPAPARVDAPPHGYDDPALQKLWLAMQRRDWRSLAVVPAAKGISTLEVATLLAKIAWFYRGQPTCVADLRDLSMRLVELQLRDIAEQTSQGDRVIIALRSTSENPTAIAVANVTDAAVLCVRLGETESSAAQRTIEEIGKARFVGSIIVNPEKKAGP